jgi:hypothetical protein
MFLRWMVRKDGIDIGIWDFIDPADLTIPSIHTYTRWENASAGQGRRPLRTGPPGDHGGLEALLPLRPLEIHFFLCHGIGIGRGVHGEEKRQVQGEMCRL